MKNADKFVVGGLVYDVLSPATFGDYMEIIGSACINPDGYAENKLFLAYDDNVQKLFRATTAIAYSEILIKNTNCEPTTMAEALANALSAGGVSYDNNDSGLTASNVQGAIDEVNGNVETVNNDLSNMTNPNLFDNPWFTVNQRGFKSSVVNNSYGFDRWKGVYSYDSTNKCLRLAQASDYVQQYIDDNLKADLNNRQMTLSVKYADGTITSGTFTYKSSQASYESVMWDDYLLGQITTRGNIAFTAYAACSIVAAKLELGSVSTLAMDTIPDYAIEIAKCRASTVDPNDTYANQGQINVGTPNPNLFDNPWFTVNQRNFSTSVTNTYGFDRWWGKYSYDSTNKCLRFAQAADWYQQKFDTNNKAAWNNKQMCVSVKYSDGTIHYGRFIYKSSLAQSEVIFDDDNLSGQLGTTGDIGFTAKTSCSVVAVKLELGENSTLALETLPNYAEELLNCQRYFQRLKKEFTGNYTVFGMVQSYDTSSTKSAFMIPTPVKMRATPSITLSGTIKVVFSSGGAIAVSSFDHAGYSTSNMICGDINLASAPTVASSFGRMYADNDGTAYIDLSAEL